MVTAVPSSSVRVSGNVGAGSPEAAGWADAAAASAEAAGAPVDGMDGPVADAVAAAAEAGAIDPGAAPEAAGEAAALHPARPTARTSASAARGTRHGVSDRGKNGDRTDDPGNAMRTVPSLSLEGTSTTAGPATGLPAAALLAAWLITVAGLCRTHTGFADPAVLS
jgi:hypothetical protein